MCFLNFSKVPFKPYKFRIDPNMPLHMPMTSISEKYMFNGKKEPGKLGLHLGS